MKTNEKNTQQGVVPALRFPEFQKCENWDVTRLKQISTRITTKVGDSQLLPISISAGIGFVAQTEKFGRDISGEQYHNYIELNKGEFAYNKGNSKKYPQGCVYRLEEFDKVAAPNAFLCFRFNDNVIPDFFKGYFDSNYHGKQLQNIITSGARSNGLLNIGADDFFNIILPIPKDKAEQQKIAECLASIDALIKAAENKIDELKAHKKGLMQQLFPAEGKTVPALRFPEFQNAGEWTKIPLSQIGEVLQGYGFPETYQGKLSGKYPFYKVSDISKAVQGGSNFISSAANYIDDEELDILKIKTIPSGTTIFARIGEAIRLNRRIVTTQECIIDNNTVGVKAITEKAIDLFVYYSLLQIDLIDFAGGVVPAVTKFAIENIPIYCPPAKSEQQKIADCLSSVDDLITTQTNRLEALRNHKKGLMQQLFPNVNNREE
ncbi:MAG: restriction endonuclease subunit S [Alistipes sp.]|nr:restriction endonuclease subunit S [Alistipes sp.]